MKREIFTSVGLVILYLVVTFVLDNSLIWLQAPIHLILASVVAFLIFRKDSKPIKKGLVFSLIILVAMNIANYLLGSINTEVIDSPGLGVQGLLSVILLIENPITYALIFLISFNIPFIVKQFTSKKVVNQLSQPNQ